MTKVTIHVLTLHKSSPDGNFPLRTNATCCQMYLYIKFFLLQGQIQTLTQRLLPSHRIDSNKSNPVRFKCADISCSYLSWQEGSNTSDRDGCSCHTGFKGLFLQLGKKSPWIRESTHGTSSHCTAICNSRAKLLPFESILARSITHQ